MIANKDITKLKKFVDVRIPKTRELCQRYGFCECRSTRDNDMPVNLAGKLNKIDSCAQAARIAEYDISLQRANKVDIDQPEPKLNDNDAMAQAAMQTE